MKRPVKDIRHHTDILKVVRLMDRINSSWWGKEWGGGLAKVFYQRTFLSSEMGGEFFSFSLFFVC